MTGQGYRGFLRQLSAGSTAALLLPPYPLLDEREIVIGRDPNCQVILEPTLYISVSRRHAAIRPFHSLSNGLPRWEICDLNSANGTYINGQVLRGCQVLQAGDRIELGQDGPVFIFECQFSPSSTPRYSAPPEPTNVIAPAQVPMTRASVAGHHKKKPDSVTFTQLFPIASTGRDLQQKAFLIPGVLTVVFVVLMFAAVGQPLVFNLLLAGYLAGAASFFVYRLCGKPKPWLVLIGCAATTGLILASPLLQLFIFIFREVLPGDLPKQGEMISLASLFVRMFFGAGLMEELLKALPLLGAFLIGVLLPPPWRERVGVWEPLDGILLGTASAVGFTLLETLGQYVPEIINDATLQVGVADNSQLLQNGQLLGLQLLIPRVLGSVAGHMAYSGYFGYFIGLSVLKPSSCVPTLVIGYLCAAVLHALWNATGFVSPILLAVVGTLSYALLAAAILKARALSPTRSQNFATGFFSK